jgi:hypothetical protein
VLLFAAQALKRDRRGGGAPDRLGVLANRLGLEVAGRNRRHGDAVLRPIRRQLAREPLHAGPGDARVDHAGQSVVGRERHVDDRSPAGRAHGAIGRRTRHAQRPLNVQAAHGVPALGLDRLRRGEVLTAGVVDQDVELAMA